MKLFGYSFIFVCVLNLALPYLCEGNDSIVLDRKDLPSKDNFDLSTRDKSVSPKGNKKKKYNRRVLVHGFMMRKRAHKDQDDDDFSITSDGPDLPPKEVKVPAQIDLLVKWLRNCQSPITFVLKEPDENDS